MKLNLKPKAKFIIILTAEFLAIAILLILVFFAGKKSYDVTFDLNGGTLISGSLTQRVTQGQSATPPSAVKDGHYLRGWSGSYNGVTSDRTIRAIWEYETTAGIIYSDTSNTNYCEIVGCYSEISGDVYIGAYYNNIKVLGIKESAFAANESITAIYLLDGILKIGASAFDGCTALHTIDLPSTLTRLGDRTFADCEALENIVLPEGLQYIGAEAFKNCTSLKKIVIPSTVKAISASAFEGCVSLESVEFAEGTKTVTIENSSEHGISFEDIFGDGEHSSTVAVSVPSKVTAIEARAFAGCVSLTSIVLPEALTKIGASAFAGCALLEEVVIFPATEIIETGAFDNPDTLFLATIKEENMPTGWAEGWKNEESQIEWEYKYPQDNGTANDK